jgi:glutamate synthase domain-containing protein 3
MNLDEFITKTAQPESFSQKTNEMKSQSMKTMTPKEATKALQKLTLFDGEFDSNEAKEILTNIFSSKIQFYKIKNYSSQVRFETDDNDAQKRIPALMKELDRLKEMLTEAKLKNKKLIINSEINISFSEDK